MKNRATNFYQRTKVILVNGIICLAITFSNSTYSQKIPDKLNRNLKKTETLLDKSGINTGQQGQSLQKTDLKMDSVTNIILKSYDKKIYFTHNAGTLPTYMPGYEAGSAHTHFKHGVGSIIIAIGLFIVAWFQSGKKN